MKKLAIVTLILSIVLCGFSQERALLPKSLRNVSKEAVFVNPIDEVVDMGVNPNPYTTKDNEEGEDIVGTTLYDLQSHAMLGNRIHIYPDGSIGAVWTRGVEEAPNFEDRGTGYNFCDGDPRLWLDEPTARVEDERTGWPSYAPLGENGEIIVAHLESGLKISSREQRGTGNWTYQTITGPTNLKWPRVITVGENHNNIHIITNSYDPYDGQNRALFYYRSLDAGTTWDIEAEVIEGTGSDYYTEINADNYVWAEPNGGAIAFLVGSAWTDLFMMKSTNNGDSWEKTVIWEHPYPMFDWETTITDTFYCVDNSANIMLDNDGMAHVVFGINRVMHLEPGSSYNFFPFVDGIGYWNENMDTFSNNLNALSPYSDDPESELIEDYSLIGWTQDVNGNGEIDFITWDEEIFQSYNELGVSTMPSISFSYTGGIFVAFSSTTETYENGITNLKHIWWRERGADGDWSNEFREFTEGVFHILDECIYPIATVAEGYLNYVFYQADMIPGLAIDEDHEYDENRMIVAYCNFFIGVNENTVGTFTVSQNSPNPAISTTKIIIDTEKKCIINLSVSNILGQVIHQETINNSTQSNTFNLNVNNLNSGVYFYTIEIENNSITKKMIVK